MSEPDPLPFKRFSPLVYIFFFVNVFGLSFLPKAVHYLLL